MVGGGAKGPGPDPLGSARAWGGGEGGGWGGEGHESGWGGGPRVPGRTLLVSARFARAGGVGWGVGGGNTLNKLDSIRMLI